MYNKATDWTLPLKILIIALTDLHLNDTCIISDNSEI